MWNTPKKKKEERRRSRIILNFEYCRKSISSISSSRKVFMVAHSMNVFNDFSTAVLQFYSFTVVDWRLFGDTVWHLSYIVSVMLFYSWNECRLSFRMIHFSIVFFFVLILFFCRPRCGINWKQTKFSSSSAVRAYLLSAVLCPSFVCVAFFFYFRGADFLLSSFFFLGMNWIELWLLYMLNKP